MRQDLGSGRTLMVVGTVGGLCGNCKLDVFHRPTMFVSISAIGADCAWRRDRSVRMGWLVDRWMMTTNKCTTMHIYRSFVLFPSQGR